MPYPYVTSAKFTGGQMTFSVLVGDFQGNEEEYVEISGYATQIGGAFANIYKIVPIPAKANGSNDQPSVDVTVDPSPAKKFRKDQDVTVAIRVSKVWVTVLRVKPQTGRQPEDTVDQSSLADDSTTWDDVRQVSEMYSTSAPAGAS